MIVKDEAVVLKTMNYGETSKIVTLFARKHGRISVIAKGARDTRRRFGASLDSLNHVQTVFYHKEGRDLQFLSQCDVVTYFSRLSTDLRRLAAGMTVLDLVRTATHPGEENSALFDVVIETLHGVQRAEGSSTGILLRFELAMLEILGFRPDLFHCAKCRKDLGLPLHGGTNLSVFRLHPGGILCAGCVGRESRTFRAGGAVVDLLRDLQTRSVPAAAGLPVDPALGEEAAKVLWFYLSSHLEGIRPLKSEAVFSVIA